MTLNAVEWINPGRPNIAGSGNIPYIDFADYDRSRLYPDLDATTSDVLKVRRIRLERRIFQMHIGSEVFRDSPRQCHQIAFASLLGTLVSAVKSRQSRNFIYKVCFERHMAYDAIMLHIIAYTERIADLEYACSRAQEAFQRVIRGYDTGRASLIDLSPEQLRSIEILLSRNVGYQFEGVDTFFDDSKMKQAEMKALNLLQPMLRKEVFKDYKENGVIRVIGKSGKIYAIYKHSMIKVYTKNKKFLYRLCIQSKSKVPPTDQVIARMKLVLADENLLHKIAHKFNGEF